MTHLKPNIAACAVVGKHIALKQKSSLTVMLVDDQPARAALLEQALRDHSYTVIARLSSAAGLAEQVAKLEPDVIVIDIESPDRDTLENMALASL